MPQRYPNIKLELTRIEILEQMVTDNPANSFARYGLAMEHVKAGELDRAMEHFGAILDRRSFPTLPLTIHGGQALEKLGRIDDARDYYRRGVGAARDPHARSELQAALDKLDS